MRRYIDADELQKDGWKLHREKHGLTTSTFETMELDCVPTADVVEVVRCKDCKHRDTNECPYDTVNYMLGGWDFCSSGERADA